MTIGIRCTMDETPPPSRLAWELRLEMHSEQIIHKLKTSEKLIVKGKTLANTCPAIEVTQAT